MRACSLARGRDKMREFQKAYRVDRLCLGYRITLTPAICMVEYWFAGG